MARKTRKPLTSDEYESYTKGSDKPKPKGIRGASAKERKAVEAAKKRSGGIVTAGEKKEAKTAKTAKGRGGAKAAAKPAAASAARASRAERAGRAAGKAYSTAGKVAKGVGRAVLGAAKRHPVGAGLSLAAMAAPAVMGVAKKSKEKRAEYMERQRAKRSNSSSSASTPSPTPTSKAKSSNSSSPKGGTGYSGKSVRTKGGDYPVYKKSSGEGKSFREAFAAARKAGKGEFTWQGRKYNTKTK